MLQESQKALKRTNSLTLADLIALSGAEAIAAVGGPEISVQLGRTDNPNLNEMIKAVSKGGLKEAQAMGIAPAFDVGKPDAADISGAFKKAGFTDHGAVHKKGLDRGAIAVSVEDTVRLFNYYDKDRSGSLSYAEFMKLLQNSVAIDYRPLVVGEDTAVTVSGGYGGNL